MRGKKIPVRLAEARALFCGGASLAAVARALGTHPATIYRWRAADCIDWYDLRAKTGATSPGGVLLGLEQLMGSILLDSELGPAVKADAVAKVSGVLTRERAHWAEAAGLSRFARWAAAALPEAAGRVVLDAVAGYVQALRNGDAPGMPEGRDG
jgi:hypothetical protein